MPPGSYGVDMATFTRSRIQDSEKTSAPNPAQMVRDPRTDQQVIRRATQDALRAWFRQSERLSIALGWFHKPKWLKMLGSGAGLHTAALLLACCTTPSSTASYATDDAEAEAAQLARLVVPITSPLRLQYRPTPPIPLQMAMALSINGKSSDGEYSLTMDSRRVGDVYRVTSVVDRGRVGTQTFSCGSQPLLTVVVDITSAGRTQNTETITPTRGCPASEDFATSGGPNALFSSFSILPIEGITTGTTLEQQSIRLGSMFGSSDTRAIVAGQTDWHGRPALLLRLAGCVYPSLPGTSSFCPRGVAFLDIASGLPIGGVIHAEVIVEGQQTVMTVRMYPR